MSRCRLAVVSLLATLTWAAPEAAQPSVAAPDLKAAFIYNFAKFVEWPASPPPRGRFSLCVAGDTAVADALDHTIRGRAIGTRLLDVARISIDKIRDCDVLYVTGLAPARRRKLLDELRFIAILTVSDDEGFAQAGGHVGLFVESGKMRFAINVEAARRAHIQISSRLLSLATLVKEGAPVTER